MVENLVFLALEKSGEIVLGMLLKKFWEWVLSDRHLQRGSNFLKMRILILYLDWVLLKTPLKSLSNQLEENLSKWTGEGRSPLTSPLFDNDKSDRSLFSALLRFFRN